LWEKARHGARDGSIVRNADARLLPLPLPLPLPFILILTLPLMLILILIFEP